MAGTVISASTGEPLKKARIFLWMTDAQDHHPKDATTDAAGRFSIDQIEPGRYTLSVSHTGYVPQEFGQDKPDKPGATLTLSAAQKVTDLLFRLERMAAISGRVLDEDGQPLEGVTVEVLSRARVRKKVVGNMAGRATTDDRGEYRVFDLVPGRYSVRATVEGRTMFGPAFPADQDSNNPAASYVPIYYPGSPELDRASLLDVSAGDEISSIDFLFSPQNESRTYSVRGHVTNAITGHPDAHVSVMLIPRGGSDWRQVTPGAQPDFKTGAFELKSVPPGAYTAVAVWFDGSRMRGVTQDVEVSGADVDGVSLVLANGVDIQGHISFEGHAESAAGQLTIDLEPSSEVAFGSWAQARVQADGSFVFSNVGDGEYSIGVNSKCDDCFIKSATANGTDVLKSIQIAAQGGAPKLDLVYSSNTGTATGMVTKEDGLPATGAYVVLVPDAAHSEMDEYQKNANTDQYGRFEIRGVPPGNYTVYAWEKMDEDQDYTDPDFLKQFSTQAQSIEISANQRGLVQLKLIPEAAVTAASN